MASLNSNAPNTALILAAGFGKRLLPLTTSTPKALIEIAGIPMLDRTITTVRAAGIKNIIVNTHYLAEQLHTHIRRYHPDIQISHEEDILETGGGILNVMKNKSEQDFLIANSDTLFFSPKINPLKQLLSAWQPSIMDFLLLAVKKERSLIDHPGDFDIESGIINFAAQTKPYIFSGAYVISPRFFDGYAVSKFRVPEVIWNNPDKKMRYHAIVSDAIWSDIGTTESLATTNEYILEYKLG